MTFSEFQKQVNAFLKGETCIKSAPIIAAANIKEDKELSSDEKNDALYNIYVSYDKALEEVIIGDEDTNEKEDD